MIKLLMHKTYFHNDKLLNENNGKKKSLQTISKNINSVVDINILLNRIKNDKKNKIKEKIIFFGFIMLLLSLFGTFIAIVK